MCFTQRRQKNALKTQTYGHHGHSLSSAQGVQSIWPLRKCNLLALFLSLLFCRPWRPIRIPTCRGHGCQENRMAHSSHRGAGCMRPRVWRLHSSTTESYAVGTVGLKPPGLREPAASAAAASWVPAPHIASGCTTSSCEAAERSFAPPAHVSSRFPG